MNEEQFSKLPVWARTEIQNLRGQISNLAQIISDMTQPSEFAEVTYSANGYDNEKALPRGATIYFKQGKRCVTVRQTPEGLNVNGEGLLAIKPHAANSITIQDIK